MKISSRMVASVGVFLHTFLVFVSAGSAHEIFQDILKEKYTLKSFSCKTCHPDGDDRTIRTPYADLYYVAMKDGNWTEKYAIAAAQGEAAVKEFDKEIGEAFKKSLDQVGKSTLTVDELFASGLLAGIRIDEKKMKAKASGKDASPGSKDDAPDEDSDHPAPKPTTTVSLAILPRVEE